MGADSKLIAKQDNKLKCLLILTKKYMLYKKAYAFVSLRNKKKVLKDKSGVNKEVLK